VSLRGVRDAVQLTTARALEGALSLEPAVVQAAPVGGLVSVLWRGATVDLPYSDHLTGLDTGQVVLLLDSAASGPYVLTRPAV
jgi:hypothetical protein